MMKFPHSICKTPFVWFVTLLITMPFLTAYGQSASEGVQWKDMTLREALDSASAQGKRVFLDCYTKTCGPCKFMVKKIFTLPECGSRINPCYVPIMMDMEEGEGQEVAKKYGVRMYPTYLALNPDGSVYFLLEGGASKTVGEFLKKLETSEKVADMNVRYAEGDRNPEFINTYLKALVPASVSRAQKVMSDYVMSLPVDSLATESVLSLVTNYTIDPTCPAFLRILDNRHELQKIAPLSISSSLTDVIVRNLKRGFRMSGDLEAWVKPTELLEADGIEGSTILKYSLIARNIVNHRDKSRVNEIVDILKALKTSNTDNLTNSSYLLESLSGIERIATEEQCGKIADALSEIWPEIKTLLR